MYVTLEICLIVGELSNNFLSLDTLPVVTPGMQLY